MNLAGTKIYQVDSFTLEAFGGNPAGVCVLKDPIAEKIMQKIAMEMNLSETAFLWPEKNGFSLRWFTPIKEASLCGHATLAAAHILWQKKHIPVSHAPKFFTKSGELSAWTENEKICLDFPLAGPTEYEISAELRESIGYKIKYTGKNSQNDLMVVVGNAQEVINFEPNLEIIKKQNIRGLIISAAYEQGKYDFVSRFFAPAYGINEDPVTGSAHCCLAPYWSKELKKDNLVGFQASNRGGIVGCELKQNRVILRGHALSMFCITML